MKTQDKIMKATLTAIEAVKDTVERNIIGAVQGKQLTLQPQSLPGLVLLVKRSIDDGFQKGYTTLNKQIAAIIEEGNAAAAPASKSARKGRKEAAQ